MTNILNFYQAMLSNITEIEKILPVPDPLGDYSFEDQIKIKSYYLLTHAEIEYFIERCVIDKINLIVNDFKTNSTPHICLISLIFVFLKEDDHIKSLKRIGDIIGLVDHMHSRFHSVINLNNGVKEENLEKLFSPLGLDYKSYLGSILVADLTTLGAKRGDYAHNALHVKSVEDPSIALVRTAAILSELNTFVDRFNSV